MRRPQGPGFRSFRRWCLARRLCPLPANPWAVSAYLGWCERRHGLARAYGDLDDIDRAHLFGGARPLAAHPLVRRTLAALVLRAGRRAGSADLFEDPAKSRGPSKPKTKKPAQSPAESRARRPLSMTPRLVSRRPGGGAT
ncbi:MAG: hypothetical protein ACPGNT_02960 [Rhodospirillales bacterium]